MTQEELRILNELIERAQYDIDWHSDKLQKAKITLNALIEKRESNK